jgi:hypothetical protein
MIIARQLTSRGARPWHRRPPEEGPAGRRASGTAAVTRGILPGRRPPPPSAAGNGRPACTRPLPTRAPR